MASIGMGYAGSLAMRVFALYLFTFSLPLYACKSSCDSDASGDEPLVMGLPMTANDLSRQLAQPTRVGARWRPPDQAALSHGFASVQASGEEALTFWFEVPANFHSSAKEEPGESCDTTITSKHATLRVTSDSGRVDETLSGPIRLYEGAHFEGAEPVERSTLPIPAGGDGNVYFTVESGHIEASVRKGHATYVFLASD